MIRTDIAALIDELAEVTTLALVGLDLAEVEGVVLDLLDTSEAVRTAGEMSHDPEIVADAALLQTVGRSVAALAFR